MNNYAYLFDRYPKSLMMRFNKFHSKNPHVYEKFKELAFRMKATGRKKYSTETIINVIRWHADLQTKGDVFAINNDFKSIYVRLLINDHPEFFGFFELRQNAPNRGFKSQEQLMRENNLEYEAYDF